VILLVCHIAILLGSIKVPYTELKRRIIEMDEEKLDVAQIEQLIRYMPEPEQMSQLAGLKDEYDTLAEPEQFGVVVSFCHTSFGKSNCLFLYNSCTLVWLPLGV